jgi:hypothetical protein
LTLEKNLKFSLSTEVSIVICGFLTEDLVVESVKKILAFLVDLIVGQGGNWLI